MKPTKRKRRSGIITCSSQARFLKLLRLWDLLNVTASVAHVALNVSAAYPESFGFLWVLRVPRFCRALEGV